MKSISNIRRRKPEKAMYIIAGCNGSGKTTAFRKILSEKLGNPEYVNPDQIARELNPNHQLEARISAARETIARIDSNIENGITFCVETTLTSKVYRNIINKAHENDYKVHLYYFWLESAEMSFRRVKQRAEEGKRSANVDNHSIPEEDIKRRYPRSVNNLFNMFIPIVDTWKLYDNNLGLALMIADNTTVYDETMFHVIKNNDLGMRVTAIDIDLMVSQIGIRRFSETVLKDKMERGESVIYSINGIIYQFSPDDILWLFDNFQRDLDEKTIEFLKMKAQKGEDIDYFNRFTFPASEVLKLYGIKV